MTWASTVPAALDGLVAIWTDATDLQGVKIIDGPTVSGGLKEALIAGWEGDDGTEAVAGQLASGGLALAPSREQYTINCAAMALRGGTRQMQSARARAYELFAAAAEALAADKTLRGAVMTARLGSMTLTQTQDSRGCVATVVFGVDVDAMTRT